MKNIKLKLVLVLVVFSFTFLLSIDKTNAIYREVKSTTINITVSSGNDYTVTFVSNGGTSVPSRSVTPNSAVGILPIPTRTDYNFAGWYDANNQRVTHQTLITGDTYLHAEWTEVICKRVTDEDNLHTETCVSGGCRAGNSPAFSANATITYGAIGDGVPSAGDAYDCDVNYDGVYDAKETDNKTYKERFYFVREIVNSGSENTAALVYSTSFDINGRNNRVEDKSVGSYSYTVAEGYLPTKTTPNQNDAWDNPGLINLDGNGKVSRFISIADIESVCGPMTYSSTSYLVSCQKWIWYENSRFQSTNLGRAGIWLEHASGDTDYYRIQTEGFDIMVVESSSENMARPTIEIPMSALEGYYDETRFTINFNTYPNDPNSLTGVKRYRGEAIGTLPIPRRENYSFENWYTDSTYQYVVNPTALVSGNMTLFAKWEEVETVQVTLYLNDGELTGVISPITLNYGDLLDNLPDPTKTNYIFRGWYTDSGFNTLFDDTLPITSNTSLYAKWQPQDAVAEVNGEYFNTLAAAIVAVPEGTNSKTRVTVLKDITLTSSALIPSGKWVELNLQNYTLNTTSCDLIKNSGKLDIINGTLLSTYSGSSNDKKGYVIMNGSGATLNISGGLLKYNNTSASEAKVIKNISGTVNITGGELECNATAAAIDNITNGTVNMSGGSIISTGSSKGQAIYNDGGSVVKISGDAYLENKSASSGNNARAAVDNVNGTITITGGTIVSKAYAAVGSRGGSAITTIGIEDAGGNIIDTTVPVLIGKQNAIAQASGTVNVFDGVYKSGQSGAYSGVVSKPSNTDFLKVGTETTTDGTFNVYYLERGSGGPYTVTFNPNNNTGTTQVPNIASLATVGALMPSNPTKENYIFEKWFIYKEVNNEIYDIGEFTSSTPVSDDITVMAKWKPSIGTATISPNSISIEVYDVEKITVTGPADMENYTLTSSNPNVARVDANGNVIGVANGSTVITITGTESNEVKVVTVSVGGAGPSTCTVTFNTNGGTTIVDQTLTCGEAFGQLMPADPTKSDYIFDGWIVDGTGNSFTSSTPISTNITVNAQWVPSISLATVSPNSLSIEIGDTSQISITNIPTGVEPFTISSSNTSIATISDLVVTGVNTGTTSITVRGDRSGYVHTINVTVTQQVTCKITFNSHGGTPVSQETVECGNSLSSMPTNPEKTDYIFDNWTIENTNTVFDTSVVVNSNITIEANWTPSVSLATVSPSSIRLAVGDTETISITDIPNGMEQYTVSSIDTGVATISNLVVTGVTLGTTSITVTGNRSGYTHTISVSVLPSHNVTFNQDNGDTPIVKKVITGDSLEDYIPTNPSKTNSVFDDWFLYDTVNDTMTSNIIDSNEVITEDRVFKAKWAPSGTVCKIYGTENYYQTIQDAVNAAPQTQTTITMLADINDLQTTISTSSNTNKTKNLILDLNNHRVAYTKSTDPAIINWATLEIKNGTITSVAQAGVINVEKNGTLIVNSGTIENTNNRQAIYNDGANVEIGGSAILKAKTNGEYKGVPRATISTASGSVTITGGTIINTDGSAVGISGGTLEIGTDDGTINITTPVLQGYSSDSNINAYGLQIKAGTISIYDGIFKGKTDGINDINKVSYPSSATLEVLRQEVIDGNTYKLAYLVSNNPTPTPTPTPAPTSTPIPTPQPDTYTITFNSRGGTISPSSVDIVEGNAITNADLPTTAEWGNKILAGWYTTEDYTVAVVPGTTIPNGDVTYYAKWTLAPSGSITTYRTTNDAMVAYYNNINTWKNDSTNFPTWTNTNTATAWAEDDPSNTPMFKNFVDNGCACYDNQCSSSNSGSTRCDLPKGYVTGVNGAVDVYLFDETTNVIGEKINYAKSTNGTIYNLVPGQAYYWEKHGDASIYGHIKFTGERRILDTGDVRNTRDLGGLSVVDSNGNTIGQLKYEKLYRGMKLESANSVTELTNLGIDSELDVRESNSDANRLTRYQNLEAKNYYVIPYTTATPSHTANQTELDYYAMTRQGVKYAMQEIVAGRSVYFHCRIGADRTGTIAYILEGLLGVPEEERIQDYELSFFSGLVRIHRYHNQKPGSDVGTGYERFTYMHNLMPTNQNIYNWYMYANGNNQSLIDADDNLIAQFKAAMINYN